MRRLASCLLVYVGLLLAALAWALLVWAHCGC